MSMSISNSARRVLIAASAVVAAAMSASAAFAPPADALAYGPYTCKSGFVWREAFYGDSKVCVTPQHRDAVKAENAAHRYRVQSNGWCVQGYVWREAIPSDLVCVPPAARSREVTANNNAIYNLQDPKQTPRGGVSIWTQNHQMGGYINAYGGGVTPNAYIRFFESGGNAAWSTGVRSLSALWSSGNGSVSGYAGDLRCRSGQIEPATIMVLDTKTGTVTTAGTSYANMRCG